MILEAESASASSLDPNTVIRLPAGMVGLPNSTEFELVTNEASLPIMWLRSTGADRLNFPVVEPGPLVPDYQLEISDADMDFLGAPPTSEALLILTVLNVKSLEPQKATINLVAPVIVNRQTLVGKQVLLSNSERYSIEHTVIDETAEAAKC